MIFYLGFASRAHLFPKPPTLLRTSFKAFLTPITSNVFFFQLIPPTTTDLPPTTGFLSRKCVTSRPRQRVCSVDMEYITELSCRARSLASRTLALLLKMTSMWRIDSLKPSYEALWSCRLDTYWVGALSLCCCWNGAKRRYSYNLRFLIR